MLLCLVVAAALLVGVYANRNPNGIQFGAPWPAASEMFAAVTAATLAFSVWAQRRESSLALFALGCGLALIALLMLGFVALGLSIKET